MSTTTFYSAKGGQGCSTVAAATAVVLSRTGNTLLVDHGGDQAALLGVSGNLAESGKITVSQSLTIVHPDEFYSVDAAFFLGAGFDHVVIDIGLDHDSIGGIISDQLLLVTTSCYMALRRAMFLITDHKPDGVVLWNQSHRALTDKDVTEVIGAPLRATFDTFYIDTEVVVVMDEDPAVARSIDAGLLACRLPKALERAVAAITIQEVTA